MQLNSKRSCVRCKRFWVCRVRIFAKDDGSTLYFTASILSGQDTYIDEDGNEVSYDTYSEGLFRFDPDSGECVQLVNYVDKPDVEDLDDGTQIFRSSNSSTEIHALAAGTDGTLWIYRRTDLYTDDGEMGPSLSELIQLDAHGTLLRTIIPANEEDPNSTGDWGYSHLDTLLSDDKGYVYTYDYQTVNVYGPDGSFVFSKSADELSGHLCQLSAGEVGVLTTYNDGKMAFKQLDPETKNWGKETPVSSRAWGLQPGNDVYRYFFIDGGNIFGERKDTGEVEKVVDWLRQKGLSKAAKKAGRATSEGLVGFELAADGKSGVAVEVKCETDFVARGDKFQGFVKDMVAQVAKGEYADSEALLAAPFVADASVTVKEALDGVIATTGENMGLGKFAKMELAAGKSGLIGGYLHSNGKLAVLVEMQTGSDAAAASEAFHEVAKNVAMQIAAASPLAVSAEGLNPEVVEHEREVYRQKAREEGKPEQIIEKIAEGAVKKFCKDVCLLDQLYIRDDKMTISDLIKGAAKTIGEPITVVRFVRIQLGAE